MKRIIAIVVLSICSFFIVTSAYSATPRPSSRVETCTQYFPYGMPQSKKSDVTAICREGYLLLHDNKAKIPVWVAYSLTPLRAMGCSRRTNDFDPEISIPPELRAAVRDYSKSGYDIGHMASNADMRWTPQVEIESNVLSNAAPQLPALNRGPWKQLEETTRVWAVERKTNLLIFVGPIYDRKSSSTIGNNRVVVPEAFYRIIIDQKNGDVMSFIYPADATAGDPSRFLTSFQEVQRQTGVIFPLPENAVLSTKVWWSSSKSVAANKAAFCK